MGGDTFEGVSKLTNAEYLEITTQLIQRLKPFCERIEPYIPLPQKQVHGDIDFLVILKQKFKEAAIIEQLKIQKLKRGKNTINSVYKNKQVDYFFVENDQQFNMVLFYKSYGGLGAYLGVFLPSKIVKLTHYGLIALGYFQKIKIQFTVSNEPKQILQFYGLNSNRYQQGFKTRAQLFEFFRQSRFLNEQVFAFKQHRDQSKLIKLFCEYLKQTGINKQKKYCKFAEPLKQTLDYFNSQAQYKKEIAIVQQKMQRGRIVNKKFNAAHLLEYFQFSNKKYVDQIKREFKKKRFQNNDSKYCDFIQQNQLKHILKQFEEQFNLKIKQPQEGKAI